MQAALAPKPSEALYSLLESTAKLFDSNPNLQEEMKGSQGWINASVGFRTADNKLGATVIIEDGHVSVRDHITEDVDACLVFRTAKDILDFQNANKDDASRMVLRGRMWIEGTIALYNYCEYLVNLLFRDEARAAVEQSMQEHQLENLRVADGGETSGRSEIARRKAERLRGERVDPGVIWLEDPYLASWSLDDFPRLQRFRRERFETKPEVSAEHGKLLVDFFLEHGYETMPDGQPWEPNLRKAKSFRYLMSNRQPLLRDGDLLAGTYTPNPVFGLVNQPYSFGWQVWGELRTMEFRELDAYAISEETIETLHKHAMPFYATRNIQHLWKTQFGNPLAAQIHERYFSIVFYGTVSHSQITPDHRRILEHGLKGIQQRIDRELDNDPGADEEKKNTLEAMKISLDAVSLYTHNLAEQVKQAAESEIDPDRKAELEEIHGILRRVPERPAQTLHEAVQAMWIMEIALGLESSDDGPHLGRLDQILQPYFDQDMKKLTTDQERQAYIVHAIKLIGCLFLRIASHYNISMEIVSWMNSGGPPSTTINLGGVTRDGKDATAAIEKNNPMWLDKCEKLGMETDFSAASPVRSFYAPEEFERVRSILIDKGVDVVEL